MRFVLAMLALAIAALPACAQNVTVIGPITAGNCPQFSSNTVIKDSGFNCNGAPTVAFGNPTGAVGLTTINGVATTALRSDAAPPLSASVQASLTATSGNILTGTGAFGFSSAATLPAANAGALIGDVTSTAGSYATTIAANAVTNAKAAQMPANTIKGNNTTATANAADLTVAQTKTMLTVSVSVTDPAFGAKCDGSTDDTSAIQSAINSLPNDGGIVLFPVANCKITSTLTIGNGTTSAVSTKRGVILRGAGIPNTPTGLPSLNGYTAAIGPKLTWAGGAASMIAINGPLQGWGIQGLFLDCASVTGSIGLSVVSASFGDNSDLTVQNCGSVGISSTSNPLGGYTGVGNVDSLRNSWENVFVLVPNVAAAKGILLNGDSGGTSDTDYNFFTNVFIRGAGTAATFGLYLGVNDANIFNNLSISGFATAGVGMQFDYSINSNFPGSDTFIHYEIGGSTSFANLGSPGALATPSKFYGLIQANGAPAPVIANTQALEGPWIAYTPSVTCGTATFTTNSARAKILGKTTSVELDFTITAIGTCTTTLTFNLPNTPNSGAGLIGRETVNSFLLVAGAISSGNATVGLAKSSLGAFALNDRVIVSGVYENQ